MYFYLSLGSNIAPEKSAVTMVRKLCEHFGCIGLYPFRYTAPEGMDTDILFVNGLVVISSFESEIEVKSRLNEIEIKMGRDRTDPQRSMKNRSADIDILISSKALHLDVFGQASEGYVQQCFRLEGEAPKLDVFGLASHQRPASIYLDALTGDICVVEDELQTLVNGLKPTFKA